MFFYSLYGGYILPGISLEIITISSPFLFAMIFFFLKMEESNLKAISFLAAVFIFILNLYSYFIQVPNYNEFFNFLIVSNQEKAFDFLIYRTVLTDKIMLSLSLFLVLTCFKIIDVKIHNTRLSLSLLFLIYWFAMLAILSDSLILLYSTLEIVGFLIALLVIATGESKLIMRNSNLVINWGISSLLMLISMVIFSSVLGESKGIYDVTISSIPSLMKEIEYFPYKNIAIYCLLISFLIKIGIFPFHNWIVSFFKSNNILVALIVTWVYSHILFIVFIKLFVEVFQQDLNLVFDYINWIILISNLYIAFYVFKIHSLKDKLSLLLCLFNGVLLLLSVKLTYKNYDYGFYYLLTYTYFMTGLLMLNDESGKKQYRISTKLYNISRMYLISSSMFFPLSMPFISLVLLLDYFLNINNMLNVITVLPIILVVINYLVNYLTSMQKLKMPIASIYKSIPVFIISLFLLIFGIFPSLIMDSR